MEKRKSSFYSNLEIYWREGLAPELRGQFLLGSPAWLLRRSAAPRAKQTTAFWGVGKTAVIKYTRLR
jgi:hypothetical protein